MSSRELTEAQEAKLLARWERQELREYRAFMEQQEDQDLLLKILSAPIDCGPCSVCGEVYCECDEED